MLGPSGCGKTTLLNMAGGLVFPTRGRVTVDGKVITGPTRAYSYMLARDALLPWRSAQRNVEFSIERYVSRLERHERAKRWLQNVGLGGFESRSIAALSQGMRQRVALARTLVAAPNYLLMDEPFAAVDAQTRAQLHGAFLDLWQNLQATVLFVTHDIEEAILLSDRVVLFSPRPGRILEDITVPFRRPRRLDELRSEAAFHKIYDTLLHALRHQPSNGHSKPKSTPPNRRGRTNRSEVAKVENLAAGVDLVSLRTRTYGNPDTDADLISQYRAAERSREARSRTFVWVLRIAFAATILGSWDLVTRFGLVDPAFAGTPYGVAANLITELEDPTLWLSIWATASAAFLGLVSGAVAGIAAGMLLAWFPSLDRAVVPFVSFLNSLPRPALAPIFLVWFGLGTIPKVLVAWSLVFFILLLNTSAGLANRTPDIDMLTKSLSAPRLWQFWKVRLPVAMPAIVAGFRLGAVYAVLGVVVTEMVGSESGLGQLLVLRTNQFNVSGALAIIAIMATLATFLNYAVGVLQNYVDRRFGLRDVAIQ